MSARDALRDKNKSLVQIRKPSPENDNNTIISDVIKEYDTHEEISKPSLTINETSSVVKKTGRPKEFMTPRKQLKLMLTEECYDFIRDRCGRYGGMTKYVIHLIEEEMKRVR